MLHPAVTTFECGPASITTPRPFQYGTILTSYYQVVRQFTKKIDAFIPRDGYLVVWADTIGSHLSGFPTGKSLCHEPSLLAEVLATIIFRISFKHSFDHQWATKYSSLTCPRVRVPPPVRSIPMESLPPIETVWWMLDYWKTYIFEVSI